MKPLTSTFIREALTHTEWDFGNAVLYDLCTNHISHRRNDVIMAKVWLIGRAYSAAIERRRVKDDEAGGSFYVNKVVPGIKGSDIDKWISSLLKNPVRDSILSAHKQITDLFKKISGLEKRSLAAKYLHFHAPNYVYIFDSYAERAIWTLIEKRQIKIIESNNWDDRYSRFYDGCTHLNTNISELFGRPLSPRELDKVLLFYFQKYLKNEPNKALEGTRLLVTEAAFAASAPSNWACLEKMDTNSGGFDVV